MKFTLKRISFLILFIITAVNIFSAESKYYSINHIISYFNLDINYDNINNILLLKNKDKTLSLYLDMQYILLGNKLTYINGFVKSEQGQYYIPENTALIIMNYFSNAQYNYYLKNNEIYYTENSAKNKVDKYKIEDKPDLKNNDIVKKDNTKDLVLYDDQKKSVKNNIKVIIIDPGHGGKDPGAIGYNDLKEKDIVLRTALLLSDILKQKYPDKKIILTRDKDEFIELDDRSKIANNMFEKFGNSIFISIHVNASRSLNTYGFETWYLVNNYSRNVIKKGSVSQDKDVENVVNSLLNEEIYKESRDLAGKIQTNLEKLIGNVSKNRSIKEEVYFVIKKSIMPAVLVEIGFNTNKYEAIRLTKYSYLNKIADGISNGLKDFIDVYEKTQGFTR